MKKQKDCQEYIKELGQKIKIHRIMNEMSQQDLEDKSGVSKRSISRLEQGETVQVDNLFKIIIAKQSLMERVNCGRPEERCCHRLRAHRHRSS